MTRRAVAHAAFGLAGIAAGAVLGLWHRLPVRDIAGSAECGADVRVVSESSSAATAVVFHGLAGSRKMLEGFAQSLAPAGLRMYLVEFPGHGESVETFSFARADRCAAGIVGSLVRRGEIDLDRTAFIGHSLGAAAAIRLADQFPAAATIAISPPPLVFPRRMPANLLVLSAQFDLPVFKQTARALLAAAGGERTSRDDFRNRRAARMAVVPFTQHASVFVAPHTLRLSADEWLAYVLPISPARTTFPTMVPAVGLGVIGLLFLFPLVLSALFPSPRAATCSASGKPQPAWKAASLWAVAALLAINVLSFTGPLRLLRIFNGDYLATFLLLAGFLLLLFLHSEVSAAWNAHPRALALAAVASALAIAGFAGWISWLATDVWLNGPRWLRLGPLILLFFPYCLAEEAALGTPFRAGDAFEGRARRWALFLFLRLILWLAMIFALAFMNSGQVLILMLAQFLLLFSIAQRMLADHVRRRTGSAPAGALAGAILAGWFLAAVFPIT